MLDTPNSRTLRGQKGVAAVCRVFTAMQYDPHVTSSLLGDPRTSTPEGSGGRGALLNSANGSSHRIFGPSVPTGMEKTNDRTLSSLLEQTLVYLKLLIFPSHHLGR